MSHSRAPNVMISPTTTPIPSSAVALSLKKTSIEESNKKRSLSLKKIDEKWKNKHGIVNSRKKAKEMEEIESEHPLQVRLCRIGGCEQQAISLFELKPELFRAVMMFCMATKDTDNSMHCFCRHHWPIFGSREESIFNM